MDFDNDESSLFKTMPNYGKKKIKKQEWRG